MLYAEKFVNTANALTIIAESAQELMAQRKQKRRELFEAFKASLIEALLDRPEDWQAVVTEGFTRLDEVTLKTLLSAKTADGRKANTLWRADKGFAIKSSKMNQDGINLVETLINPFEAEKVTRPPKGEFEKMVSSLKTVLNRLDKVTSADLMMRENLEKYIKFYQNLVDDEKSLGE
ncbi:MULTISPECIES: hypothetical protein [Neisseria]|nr:MULTISPECIES: hypothetical protein [Neisseria]